MTQKVLIKLYGKDIRNFKLNEMVTFVGLLEYSQAQADATPQNFNEAAAKDEEGNSQMTNEEKYVSE